MKAPGYLNYTQHQSTQVFPPFKCHRHLILCCIFLLSLQTDARLASVALCVMDGPQLRALNVKQMLCNIQPCDYSLSILLLAWMILSLILLKWSWVWYPIASNYLWRYDNIYIFSLVNVLCLLWQVAWCRPLTIHCFISILLSCSTFHKTALWSRKFQVSSQDWNKYVISSN